MRRAVARWQTWWLRLFAVAVVATTVADVPFPLGLGLIAVPFLLFLVRPPATDRGPVVVAPPVRGRWTAINSPGTRVPSHGVKAYGQAYAVDLVVPADDTAAVGLSWSLRGRAPASYSSFGRPVLTVASGTVVQVRDSARDRAACSSWPLLLWMLTGGGFLRELRGAPGLLGNHVVVGHEDGTWSAYAHLQQDSVVVRPGERVETGQQVGAVGNTGNTSEPHLHVQLMDRPGLSEASGIPMRWASLELDTDEREARWTSGQRRSTALAGFPENGQVFTARPGHASGASADPARD